MACTSESAVTLLHAHFSATANVEATAVAVAEVEWAAPVRVGKTKTCEKKLKKW